LLSPQSSSLVTFQVAAYDTTKPLIIDPTLSYSTYLGGSGNEAGRSIAVDSSGNAYVTGGTTSTNFPTVSPLQATNGGGADAFVTKLNPAGSALIYSTYLGGSGDDDSFGLAIDASGNAYVTGNTASTNFPTTSGSFQTTYGGGFRNLKFRTF
ncbi:MAG: SBBP repeat-containing protein, partial [Deltaproteobacteria bacterium]|nr:SBBP repeat-containing protein [Deltaproteobacteria bacterium]